MSHDSLITILEETMMATADDWGSGIIMDHTKTELPLTPGVPSVEVTAEKAQDAALRFRGSRVAVLNFASGVNPGGGVRHAAVAQEEDLCRCSGLLHSLERLPEFFEGNRADDAPPESLDWMIISQGVPLVRNGYYQWVVPMKMTFITYPAPNNYRGAFDEVFDIDFHSEEGDAIVATRLQEIFERRCAHVIAQAALLGIEVLILGAWGCGAYGNDAEMVAQAFRDAVEKHGGPLKRIVFACFGPDANRQPFKALFPTAGNEDPSPT